MLDQRRHQRIRFSVPQKISIGYGGEIGEGVIENLSLSGLMMRTPMPLEISRNVGCEFSVFDSPLIDVPAAVVSRVCDLFGVRFQQGPISQILIDDAISAALASGKASILSVHELGGRKTMRITGGLCGILRSDFMHALTRMAGVRAQIHIDAQIGRSRHRQAGLLAEGVRRARRTREVLRGKQCRPQQDET